MLRVRTVDPSLDPPVSDIHRQNLAARAEGIADWPRVVVEAKVLPDLLDLPS